MFGLIPYSVLIVPSSVLINKGSEKEEVIRKHVKKKKQAMRWLQNAKITVIYSQEIVLDDNTICLSLFRPLLTEHT